MRPAGAPDRGRRSSWGWLLGVVGLVVVAVVVWLLVRPGSPRPFADPLPTGARSSAWDEQESPSPPPMPSASSTSGTTVVSCPTVSAGRADHPRDGALHGGGLVVDVPAGFSPTTSRFLTWARDEAAAMKPAGGTWVSFTGVAALPAASFPDPQQAADQLWQCHTTSGRFPGRTTVTRLVSEAVTVDGHPGWWVRVEIGSTQAPGGGARFDYTVVDVGNPDHLGVHWAGVTLNDTAALAAVDAARVRLRTGP